MALSGKFLADFQSFFDACSKAEVSLRGMETDANRVGPALNRMVDNFSGRRVIQDATLMTEAIARAGGASTLTAQEMATVNARVGEAIAKFTALGQTAPLSMQQLHAATRGPTEGMQLLGKAAGLVGTLFPFATVTGAGLAIVGLGRAAFTAADHIVALSDKTGSSTKFIQQLQFVAGQTGTTVDALAAASYKLGINVETGTAGARKAIDALGLSFEAVRKLKPEDQFNLVMKALEGVESVTERNRIGQVLMGKSFTEVAASVAAGYTKIKDQATVAGDASVRAAERASDAWDKAKGQLNALAINVLGRFAQELQDVAIDVDRLSEKEMQRYAMLIKSGGDAYGYLLELERERTKGMKDYVLGNEKVVESEKNYVQALAAARAEVAKLTTAQLAEIDAAQKLGINTGDIIDKMGISAEAYGLVSERVRQMKEAHEAAAVATRALADEAQKAAANLFNLDAEVNKLHSKSLPPFTGLLQNVDRTLDALPPSVAAFRSELVFAAETIETQINPALEEMTSKANAAVIAMGAASRPMGELTVGVGAVNPVTGAGKAGTDPRVWAYLEQGYTLGEAVALASGAPTNIGAAHGYWDKTGWHSGTRGGTAGMRGLAGGGAMQAGETAWVGERGPELFTPRGAGSITPHGAGGVVNNITVHTVMGNGQEIARMVQQAMVDLARAQGKRL